MLTPLIAASIMAGARPSLVVILSIDQFRADYMTRFERLYLPAKQGDRLGGFNYLIENGAMFVNARFHHVPTETGPGHAVIGTGSTPGLSGIIANSWYDRESKKSIYCVGDADSKDVETGKPSMSPKNLRVSTLGDELELATNGNAKTISISLKDRAAILMAGHVSDGTVWYSASSGGWTTSDYYSKNGKLPEWASAVNESGYTDQWRGKSWEAKLPQEVLDRYSFPTAAPGVPKGLGESFPHPLPEADFNRLFPYTPYSNDFIVKTAKQAVTQLGMGKDDTPDLLTLSFSCNDYAGHAFGPYSPEVVETAVHTDAAISELLNFLNKTVPGGLKSVMFALTADHGVLPVPQDLKDRGIPSTILSPVFFQSLTAKINQAIGVSAVASLDESTVWLDQAKVKDAGMSLATVREKVVEVLENDPNVFRAYSANDIPRLGTGDSLDEAVRNGFDPERSADVVYLLRPATYPSAVGTGHGSAWTYDTAVPLVFFGAGIRPGIYTERAGPEDIAATAAACLGIIPPNGSVGRAIGLR